MLDSSTTFISQEEPFVMKNEKGEYEGFCIDLLQEMALALDFNYTIVEVLDGTYGIEVDLLTHPYSAHQLRVECAFYTQTMMNFSGCLQI